MTRMRSWTLVLTLLAHVACDSVPDAAPALGEAAAAITSTPPLIDDFTSGLDSVSLQSGESTRLRSGDMLGGTREIFFAVDSGALEQPTSYTMNGAGGLVISSGLSSYWGAYLIYGYDTNLDVGSLDLDLRPYDAVCLRFGSNDKPVSGGVQFYKEGASTTAYWYADASSGPFSVEIPYADFDATSDPLPWEGVFLVVVLIQTGSANAGNDLEVTSVSLGGCDPP